MKRASATTVARKFSEFLGAAEHGDTVQIIKHGRVVARLVPARDFMDGHQMSELFAKHQPDPEAANAIQKEIEKLRQEEQDEVDHRYGHPH